MKKFMDKIYGLLHSALAIACITTAIWGVTIVHAYEAENLTRTWLFNAIAFVFVPTTFWMAIYHILKSIDRFKGRI